VDDLVLFYEFSKGLGEFLLDSLAVLGVPGLGITAAEGSVVGSVVETGNGEIERLAVALDLDGVGTVALLEEVVEVVAAVGVVHNPLGHSVVEAEDKLLRFGRNTARDSVDGLLATGDVLGAAHLCSDGNIEDTGTGKNLVRKKTVAVLVAVGLRKREGTVVRTTTRELDKDSLTFKGVGDLSILALEELADVVLENLLQTPENAGRKIAETGTDTDLLTSTVDALKEPAGGALDLGLLGADHKVVVVLVDEDHKGAPLVVAHKTAVGKNIEHVRHAQTAQSIVDVAHGLHIGIVVQLHGITKTSLLAQLGLHAEKLADLALATSREGVEKNGLDCAHYGYDIKAVFD